MSDSVVEPARAICQKYCDIMGTTYGLAEPYFIASYLAGVVEQTDPAIPRDKTIDSIVSGYGSHLRLRVRQVFNGESTRVALQDVMGTLIEEYAGRVFADGMREGNADPDDMDDEERKAVQDWINGQVGFVPGFVEAADNASTEAMQTSILNRVDLWAGSLRNLGDLGKAFALQNRTGKWVLGNTEIHCATCKRLAAGTPHRIKWYIHNGYIPRQNGSEVLECGGWLCDCSVIDPKTGERLL